MCPAHIVLSLALVFTPGAYRQILQCLYGRWFESIHLRYLVPDYFGHYCSLRSCVTLSVTGVKTDEETARIQTISWREPPDVARRWRTGCRRNPWRRWANTSLSPCGSRLQTARLRRRSSPSVSAAGSAQQPVSSKAFPKMAGCLNGMDLRPLILISFIRWHRYGVVALS